MTLRLLTADDLCTGADTVLTAALPTVLEALGLDEPDGGRAAFTPPANWTQVPTLEALQAAVMPAGAVTTTGITGTPRRSSTGTDATWRIRVGMFDRGRDYNETANRIRTWAAIIRAVITMNPTLGGVASGSRWVGETYRQLPQVGVARTLGGCSVEFDVDARNVMDLSELDGVVPVVNSTHPHVTVRPY